MSSYALVLHQTTALSHDIDQLEYQVRSRTPGSTSASNNAELTSSAASSAVMGQSLNVATQDALQVKRTLGEYERLIGDELIEAKRSKGITRIRHLRADIETISDRLQNLKVYDASSKTDADLHHFITTLSSLSSEIPTIATPTSSVPQSPRSPHFRPRSASPRLRLDRDREITAIRTASAGKRYSHGLGLGTPASAAPSASRRHSGGGFLPGWLTSWERGEGWLWNLAGGARTGGGRRRRPGCAVPEAVRAWVPLMIWAGTSIAFAVVVLVWHKEVFAGLDTLSSNLKELGFLGRFILFICIFLTTIPPLPLYSTFIILSGYAFGLFPGFIVSYLAALSGAVVVLLMSRTWLQGGMLKLLSKSKGLLRVVKAIEKKPKLLFLIRLSPYPYNVMNVLLASSPTLSFRTYFLCTAASLVKLLVHCGLGTTIRNFQTYHGEGEADDAAGEGGAKEREREEQGRRMKTIAGFVGAGLAVGIFIYLLIVARRAVDELDDELPSSHSHAHSLASRRSSMAAGGRRSTSSISRALLSDLTGVDAQSSCSSRSSSDDESHSRKLSGDMAEVRVGRMLRREEDSDDDDDGDDWVDKRKALAMDRAWRRSQGGLEEEYAGEVEAFRRETSTARELREAAAPEDEQK